MGSGPHTENNGCSCVLLVAQLRSTPKCRMCPLRPEHPVTIEPNLIVFKDLKLISSQSQFRVPSEENPTLKAIDLIASGKVKVKPLISHEFPVEKITEAFETQINAGESVKVLIKP